MVEEISFRQLSETIEYEDGKKCSKNFETNIRYSGTATIVTIPVKIVRELGLELGDRVIIQIRKKATPLRSEAMTCIELACEQAGLNANEIQTVLGCVKFHNNNEPMLRTAKEILLKAIRECQGADDCGLCYRASTKVRSLLVKDADFTYGRR